MQIRPVTASDIPALAQLATETWLNAFGHRFSEEEQKRRVEEYRSEAYFRKALMRDTIYVAEEEGFLGYVEFGPPDLPIPTNEGDREITRLYVRGSHQRKGIGKALLKTALDHPSMRAAPVIYLDVWEENRDAIRLYESFGFVSTGQVVDEDLIMVRKGNLRT